MFWLVLSRWQLRKGTYSNLALCVNIFIGYYCLDTHTKVRFLNLIVFISKNDRTSENINILNLHLWDSCFVRRCVSVKLSINGVPTRRVNIKYITHDNAYIRPDLAIIITPIEQSQCGRHGPDIIFILETTKNLMCTIHAQVGCKRNPAHKWTK